MGSCLTSDSNVGVDGGGGSSSSAPSSPLSSSPGLKKGRTGGGGGKRRNGWGVDPELQKIPGRMYLNGASRVASMFTQQGKKGTNQDAMIIWENFGARTDTVFCGVFDGHGPYGHMVARRVRDSLPQKLSAHWEVNIGSNDFVRENSFSTVGSSTLEENVSVFLDAESRDSSDLEEKDRDPEIFITLKESFLKAFKVMDKELRLNRNIDCFCSGTTAVTLVKQGKHLVVGNIGDSRAVLGTRDQNDSLIAVQLTVDLKPNLPNMLNRVNRLDKSRFVSREFICTVNMNEEEERIKQCKGRIFALRDEPEVARVWLPNNDSPGLAMARAFGDFCLKDFGLISVPELSYRQLTKRDEFIVLATDGENLKDAGVLIMVIESPPLVYSFTGQDFGTNKERVDVWDVLSNKEVVDIVASAPSRSSAGRALVESAVRAWRYKYPTSKVDDCAVVCLFLDDNSHDVSTASSNDSSNITSIEKQEEGSKGKGKGKEGEFPSDDGSTSAMEGDEWSALEGVSRMNTMLTLPRFSVVGSKPKKKSA